MCSVLFTHLYVLLLCCDGLKIMPFSPLVGRIGVGISISEGLSGRLCGGQAPLLCHPGSVAGNHYWNIRGTEL